MWKSANRVCRASRDLLHPVALALIMLFGTACASTTTVRDSDAVAVDKLAQQALALEQQGNLPEALTHYVTALQITPSAEHWYHTGRLNVLMGNEQVGMNALGTAVAMDPEHAAALEMLGLVYLKYRQQDGANEFLTRAIDVDYDRWRAHNGIAILHGIQGNFPEASLHFHVALDLHPQSPDILNNLGYSQFLAGMSDIAAEHLVDAINHADDHSVAWDNLATVLARQRRYADAFNILERRYSSAIAYHDIGYVASINGDYARAEDYLTKALQAAPRFFEEADHNRDVVRNRLLGNEEGSLIVRKDATTPYCIGLGADAC